MKKINEQLVDYRKLGLPELMTKLVSAKLAYQELASQIAMGKVKTVSKLRDTKKEVARLATLVREKEIITEVTNG